MRLQRVPTLPCLCVLLIVLLASPGAVAAVVPIPGECLGHGNRHLFPFLKWLRDSAAEIVLGHPAQPIESPAELYDRIRDRYRSDVIVRFNVTNSEEEESLRASIDKLYLDVWSFTSDYADIRIPKDGIDGVLRNLTPSLRSPTISITDVASTVWETYPIALKNPEARLDAGRLDAAVSRALDGVDNIFFQDYQPLSVITTWLKLLEAMFPTHVDLFSIGKSYEGREILGVRVGEKLDGSSDNGKRKTILVTGGLHAREWVSTTTVNYLIWSFVTAYGKEPLITKLLQHYNIVFMPVLNPDGYDYTWQDDRLWRKSRQQTKYLRCPGLDLDRAFGYEWDTANHQSDPCSDSYGGDEPFQAVEALKLATWARNETQNQVQFVGFIDLHAYSQQVLYPFSWSCSIDPANRESLEELAVGLAKAIRLSSGESYSVASACEGGLARSHSSSASLHRIESGGGSAIDWFYHEMKAKFSYQIKLRDTGVYGFLLPREQIVPTGQEMFNALKYFGDFLLGNNGIEKFDVSSEGQEDEEWKDL